MKVAEVPGGPVVAHVARTFVHRSEGWLHDVVTSTPRYRPVVLCEERLNATEFPLDDVQPILRRRPPLMPSAAVATYHRIFRRRLNPWAADIRRLEVDVIHAHFGPSGWACVDAGRTDVVTTFYGIDMSALPRQKAWARAYPALFRGGRAFLAEGPHMRNALVQLGAPSDRTFVQPLIADLSLPFSAPSVDAAPLVLLAGRLVEKKGTVDGVAAFTAIADDVPDARLLVIGSGPLETAVRATIDSSPARNRIEWVPFAERERYREMMAQATVLLQPSRTARNGDSEGGAPVTLLDAQAMGTLVVGTDHADIPFVTSSTGAVLAPQGDINGIAAALLSVLHDRDQWAVRAEAGRRHVEAQHGAAAVGTKLEAVYDAIR